MSNKEFTQEIIRLDGYLKNFALKLTENIANAEDLLQDTYVNAIRFRDKFTGGNLRAWVCTIMRNRFVSLYHRAQTKPKAADFDDDFKDAQGYYGSMGNRANDTLLMDDIKRAMNGIPESQLSCFMLFHTGYKYEEIAEMKGLPMGSVKTNIFKAKQKLRNKLKAYN